MIIHVPAKFAATLYAAVTDALASAAYIEALSWSVIDYCLNRLS